MFVLAERTPNQPRRGIVLLAVLVVVVILSLAAYQYSEYMQAEYQAANSHTKLAQTRSFAMSGVNYAAVMLSNTDSYTNTLNGNPFDNAAVFQDIVVQDDSNSKRRGKFSIVGLKNSDDPQASTQPYSFGVVDEAGKLNLNALLLLDSTGTIAEQMLLQLPNMTDDIANSILDWLDPNTTSPRPNGAKDEYYLNQSPAYHVKNGPLDSLEELLLVKGVTPQLLYGNDRNKNGTLDPDEDDGSGQVDRGWSAYLTVYSREPNADALGNARVYLNDQDINALNEKLTTAVGPDLANYIIAYRLYGSAAPVTKIAISLTGKGLTVDGVSTMRVTIAASSKYSAPQGKDADDVNAQIQTTKANPRSQGSLKPISSVYSLINSSVSVPVGTGNTQRTVTLQSPLNDVGRQKTLLPLLLDKTTTSKATDLPPRINVNTASQTVLSALPGLSDADIAAIINARPVPSATGTPDPIFNTPAWLITEAKLSPTSLQAVERFITARSGVYRFQAIGYFEGGGPSTRLEAVIDTNYGRPRIVHLRDLSEMGKAYPFPATNSTPSTNPN